MINKAFPRLGLTSDFINSHPPSVLQVASGIFCLSRTNLGKKGCPAPPSDDPGAAWYRGWRLYLGSAKIGLKWKNVGP